MLADSEVATRLPVKDLARARRFYSEKLGADEQGYTDVEEGALVQAGLDALDERERQIVELRFFHELTQSQIASEVGISQMHVSRLLRRALATMRGRLEEVRADE